MVSCALLTHTYIIYDDHTFYDEGKEKTTLAAAFIGLLFGFTMFTQKACE